MQATQRQIKGKENAGDVKRVSEEMDGKRSL